MRSGFDLWLILSLVILAGLGVLGTWNGVSDLQDATTRLQLATSLTQLGYGLLSLIAIPGLLIGWNGLKTVLRAWLVAISITGGLAPVAWGGASAGTGIAALILTFFIALAIIWVVRRAQVAP
jgi:hypothetical protein